jgi:DNA helicase IV
VVLRSREAKGLEFDAVVVVEPAQLVEESGSLGPLYVALTRPTQELTVVHAQPLPESLASAR